MIAATIPTRAKRMGVEARAMITNTPMIQICFASAETTCRKVEGSGIYAVYGTDEMLRSRVSILGFCFFLEEGAGCRDDVPPAAAKCV